MMEDLTANELLAIQRIFFLVGPASCAFVLFLVCKPSPREATAAMVAFLWQLQALVAINLMANFFGWWTFNTGTNSFSGLPIDVWIGWSLWWGPVVVFLNRWINIALIAAVSVAIDVATMPLLEPLVTLGHYWLIGDGVAITFGLVAGLLAAKLTREDRYPRRRANFHVLGWGGYMCLVLPLAALMYEAQPLSALYRWPNGPIDFVIVGIGALLLFVGICATAEFARSGDGTPIPYDPPKRVVKSGPYAFNANPMQIISAAFMAMLALYAQSYAIAFIAMMFLVFDGIYAAHYNRVHIAHAMPVEWSNYRGHVADWLVRWRPYVEGEAIVTIAPSGPARRIWPRVWPWLSTKLHGAIAVREHERLGNGRLTYTNQHTGIEATGTKAFGHILEHGSLPFAVIGWLIRFPYLGGGLQRLSALIILVYRRYALR